MSLTLCEKVVPSNSPSLSPSPVKSNRSVAIPFSASAELICVAALFLAAGVVVWFYDSGGWGIKLFEFILKAMVGTIVICFFVVVVKMSAEGVLDVGLG